MSFYQKYLKYKNKYLDLKNQIGSDLELQNQVGGVYKSYDIVKTIKGNYLVIGGIVPDKYPMYYYVSKTPLGLLSPSPYMGPEDIINIGNREMIRDIDIASLVMPWEWEDILKKELELKKKKASELNRLYIEKQKTEAIEKAKKSGIIDEIQRKITLLEGQQKLLKEQRTSLIPYYKDELLTAPETSSDPYILTKSQVQLKLDNLYKEKASEDIPSETISKAKMELKFAIENGVTDGNIPIASWDVNDDGSYGKNIYGSSVVSAFELPSRL
jgi:hypothetical protein